MSLVLAYQSRRLVCDFTLKDADGNDISVGASDKIRAIITHEGETAKLTVESGTNTANGSSFQKNTPSTNSHRLTLDADDLAFPIGTYSLYIDYFDNADGSEYKTAERHILSLQET